MRKLKRELILTLYEKNIRELFAELKKNNLHNYFENNSDEFFVSLHEYLQLLLEEKNLIKLDVIRQSHIDRHYAYHIFSGKRLNPSRNKVLALAIALKLNLQETQELLRHARHCELCPRSRFDSIIISSILQRLDVPQINSLLKNYSVKSLLE